MDWFGEFQDQLWRAWAYLTTGRVLATVFGIGFALLAILLWIASRTKWGQTKPLTKCVVFSVLLHVWLLIYAIGTPQVLPQGSLDGGEQNISVSIEADSTSFAAASLEGRTLPTVQELESSDASESLDDSSNPWEEPVPLDELPKPPQLEHFDLTASLAPALLPALLPTPMPTLPPPETLADLDEPEATSNESLTHDSSSEFSSADPTLLPATESTGIPLVEAAILSAAMASEIESNRPPQNLDDKVHRLAAAPSVAPQEYQLRQDPNRLNLTKAFGADADSEAAVQAALRWLAAAQSADGSWNAAQHGAGEERFVLGESRHGTGDKADTGVSGLALLAFLSGGHTHQHGEYQANVENGVKYLLRAQMPSGDLSGPKQLGNDWNVLNARMYCHSIATLALAEAYAMTRDAALRDGLLRAVQYSINAQDVRGGGWRYKPRDPGDLSQFGWQAMALRSVERSGIQIPGEVKRRMQRFLDSCAAGQYGGLATYRPRAGRPSDTMTAEALACRLLLDYPLSPAAQQEATSLLMLHLPKPKQLGSERSAVNGLGVSRLGASRQGSEAGGPVADRTAGDDANVYYWYYATLALFQLQDENWRAWNQAMKARLLSAQVPSYGLEPGSWDPDTLWAGYGGRIYSTAMSCLCLEVYYRYLPMYQHSNLARSPHSSGTDYRR